MEVAKAVCEQANRKKARVCKGVSLLSHAKGWHVGVGEPHDALEATIFECVPPTAADMMCQDVAQERRVGCIWEAVPGSSWLSTGLEGGGRERERRMCVCGPRCVECVCVRVRVCAYVWRKVALLRKGGRWVCA